MRTHLRDADVAADGFLADFIDYEVFGNVRSGSVEEDGLVERPVLLFKPFVFDGHGDTELATPVVDTFQLDGDVSNFLRFVLAGLKAVDTKVTTASVYMDTQQL